MFKLLANYSSMHTTIEDNNDFPASFIPIWHLLVLYLSMTLTYPDPDFTHVCKFQVHYPHQVQKILIAFVMKNHRQELPVQ